MADLRTCQKDLEGVAEERMQHAFDLRVQHLHDFEQAVAHLRVSQERWRVYRDEQCLAEGALREGGTSQPLVISGCRERMALARTRELDAMDEP